MFCTIAIELGNGPGRTLTRKEQLMSSNETVHRMTCGQMKDLVATVVGGVPADLSFTEAERLTGKKGEITAGVKRLFRSLVDETDQPVESSILCLLSGKDGLNLMATDGTETLVEAKDVFTGFIDPNLKDWCTSFTSIATKGIQTSVYELWQNASFMEMFTSLSHDLGRLVLTQSQIITFCEDHRSWLRGDRCPTFFLFKGRHVGQFFVAGVDFVDNRRLKVYVYPIENNFSWSGSLRHRVVIPQL